jgi:thiol-disulfide isomerase/thioredoxin
MISVKKHFGNLLLVGLLIYVAYKQVPLWMHSNEQVGKNFFTIKAVSLDGEQIEIPVVKAKTVYIFWATWCGPCHIQMGQFNQSVTSGDLKADQIVAVSLDKSLNEVRAFVKDKGYTFKVVQAATDQSWTDLNVQATPSIAFVDENNKIQDFFTGLSPLSTFKAQKFLK